MNHKVLKMVSSGALGGSFVTYVASLANYPNTSIEGSALLLIASFIGYGVARYYESNPVFIADNSSSSFALAGPESIGLKKSS